MILFLSFSISLIIKFFPAKLVPLAYGIHKLHISCVVEDDKVSVDLLQEKIQDFEDFVSLLFLCI